MTRRAAALVLGVVLAPLASAQEPDGALPGVGSSPLDPEREERVLRLGRELRCAGCQGLSIADSPSPVARAQLDKVRELVVEGKTDAQVRDFFVARYGEWALLEPDVTGINGLLWLAPLAMLLLGGLLIIGLAQGSAPGASPVPPAGRLDDALLARAKKDLEH